MSEVISKSICCDMKKQNIEGEINLLEDLRRRVEVTYRIRINAATRLRKKHEHHKRLSIYYSILVTILSIISISTEVKIGNVPISTIVLAASVILTYYMFYVSEQNLQERAYKMEETYKQLDKLKNKINIILKSNQFTCENIKANKLYKEYEVIIEKIENHDNNDYYKFQKDVYEKNKNNNFVSEEKYLEIKNVLKKNKIYENRKNKLEVYFPLILSIVILVYIFMVS